MKVNGDSLKSKLAIVKEVVSEWKEYSGNIL